MLESLVIGIQLLESPHKNEDFPPSRVVLWLENGMVDNVGQFDQLKAALLDNSIVRHVGVPLQALFGTTKLNLWLHTGSDVMEAEELAKDALELAYKLPVTFVESDFIGLTPVPVRSYKRAAAQHHRSNSFGQHFKRGGVPAPM
jgi:hypothetical protein